MELKLNNKIAIVTASTSGIGLAIALKLANEGAVVYLAARNQNKVNSIIQAWPKLKLKYVHFDAMDQDSINNCVERVIKNEKQLDILVNNFGTADVQIDKNLTSTSYETFIKTIDENLKPTYNLCQQALKYMNNNGSIVNISSVAAQINDSSRVGYSAAKKLINLLTSFVADDGSSKNIRCNAIMPGYIETSATANNMPYDFLNKFLDFNLIKRAGNVDDIANTVAFLASEVSSYISGECIPVSGGFNKISPVHKIMK